MGPENQGQTKKGRGKTLKLDIWRRKDGQKIHVQSNEKHQPIGEQASPLANFISTIVRSGVSLANKEWSEVDLNKKRAIWDTVNVKLLL